MVDYFSIKLICIIQRASTNFGSILNFADLLVGASFKKYVLNSQGTLFADTAGTIKINEVGAYAQLSRSLFGDKLRLTASGRYDKK